MKAAGMRLLNSYGFKIHQYTYSGQPSTNQNEVKLNFESAKNKNTNVKISEILHS